MAVIRDLEKIQIKFVMKLVNKVYIQKENKDDNIPERLRIVFDIRDELKDFVNNYVKTEGQTLSKDIEDKFIKSEDKSIKNISKAIITIRDYFVKTKHIDEFFPYLRTKS